MVNFVLWLIGVPVKEHADAAAEAAGHIHFVSAEERHIKPAELAGGEGGKLRIKIAREAENGAGDVLRLDPVDADHEREELARGRENRVFGVFVGGGGASDAAAEHGGAEVGGRRSDVRRIA